MRKIPAVEARIFGSDVVEKKGRSADHVLYTPNCHVIDSRIFDNNRQESISDSLLSKSRDRTIEYNSGQDWRRRMVVTQSYNRR